MGVRCQVAGRRPEQSARSPADRLKHRPISTVPAQRAQLVRLTIGQLGVELFEAIAVVHLQFWPRQLADTGQ